VADSEAILLTEEVIIMVYPKSKLESIIEADEFDW